MKDILALSPLAILAAFTNEELTFWERMAEKWGIGLVGIGLFLALAWLTNKKEERDRLAREKREKTEADAREKRETEAHEERKNLLHRNNELMETQLKYMETQLKSSVDHALRIERIAKDGNKATDDHSAAIRMMFRKMRTMPCVPNLNEADLEELLQRRKKEQQEQDDAQ